MIKIINDDILKADVDAVVNTVNCVGIMGKGIALQFKMAFPENFNQYNKACKNNEIHIGKMYITKRLTKPEYIINFPTKKHWKGKSKIEYIEKGLKDLKEKIIDLKIKSIAIPPLGCGMGGLNWPQVKKIINDELGSLQNVDIFLYELKRSPIPEEMRVGIKKPSMTRVRALLIKLLEEYKIPGYQLSLLEIQKLMYFLQEIGEPLRLNYGKGTYGPYAPNLEHLLQSIAGHFISGYGDRKAVTKINILKPGIEEAESFINENPEIQKSIDKVKEIICGFETPYGLELLSSVHWAVVHEKKKTESEIVDYVKEWNPRKENLFTREHILITFNHLKYNNIL